MTGYTVHTGSSLKFSTGWDEIFRKQKPAAKKKASARVPAAGKHPKKQAARKGAKRSAKPLPRKRSPHKTLARKGR